MVQGVVVLVIKVVLNGILYATMKCMSEVCGMSVNEMNYNKTNFNEL